jgi:hypothetical protein
MASGSFLHRYATFIVDRARAVVVATLVATGLLAAQIPSIGVHFDPESSLPPDHPFVRIDRMIRAEFGGRNTVVMAVIPPEGTVWTVPVLQRVHALTQAILDLDGLMRHTLVSLASPNMRHLEDRAGTITEDYLMREPPATAADVEEVRRRYESNPLARGMVVSSDDRAALLVLDFWDDTEVNVIAERVIGLADRFTDAGAGVYAFGEPIVVHEDFEYSVKTAPLFGVSFLAIMVVLYASFRSVQGMLVPMLTALLSVLCDLGMMALLGVDIDPWNQAVPILVVTIAAGHSAQMMKRYYEELALRRDNRAAVIATVDRIGPVMLAAGTTAAIGFAALVIFGVPAISGYGLATAYGIASAVVLEMTFIPALRSLLPVRMTDVQPAVHRGRTVHALERIADMATRPRGRGVVLGTAGVVLVVAGLGALQIRPWSSLREYLLPGSRGRRDLQTIERHFAGTNTMTILVEGDPGSAQSPVVVRFVDGLAAELRADAGVATTTSLADLIRFIRRVFDPESGGELPEDARTLAQLVYLGSSPAFERFVDRAATKTVLWAYLRTDASDVVRRILARAERYTAAHPPGEGVRVHIAGGTGPTLFALNEHTTHGKVLNIGTILLVVFAVASIILRSAVGGLFVALPLVFTLVVNLGILGWWGFALDLATTTIVAIGVGVGADYAMYLLYRIREEAGVDDFPRALRRALATSGRAVVFVALAIATGFSVMGMARHLSWRLTGVLLPVTMLVSCAAAVTLVPTLVALMRPRFVFARVLGRARARDGVEEIAGA